MMRRLPLAAATLLLSAAPALAQITPLGPIKTPDGHQTAPRAPVARPAPAGVPGARAEPELTAPASRPVGEMPPTEALFDAVNRGDLSGAKDAIGRGADIFGRNVLGLTPLELSVDLGRNDISFLLLSLRGGAGYSSRTPTTQASAPSTAEQRRADRRAELEARRQQQAAERATRATATPAAPRSARLFAGDGGAPVPRAGFLGFDATR